MAITSDNLPVNGESTPVAEHTKFFILASRQIWVVVVAAIITSLIVGGGVWWWKDRKFVNERRELKQQIDRLENQLASQNQNITYTPKAGPEGEQGDTLQDFFAPSDEMLGSKTIEPDPTDDFRISYRRIKSDKSALSVVLMDSEGIIHTLIEAVPVLTPGGLSVPQIHRTSNKDIFFLTQEIADSLGYVAYQYYFDISSLAVYKITFSEGAGVTSDFTVTYPNGVEDSIKLSFGENCEYQGVGNAARLKDGSRAIINGLLLNNKMAADTKIELMLQCEEFEDAIRYKTFAALRPISFSSDMVRLYLMFTSNDWKQGYVFNLPSRTLHKGGPVGKIIEIK